MSKRKILFLGETYRADAITWMNGLKEFGNFEIITWELKTPNHSFFSRVLRILEFCTGLFQIRKLIKLHQPDMVIAERTTSYGFLAVLCGVKPVVIAQQGRTDLWPEKSLLLPLKKNNSTLCLQQSHFNSCLGTRNGDFYESGQCRYEKSNGFAKRYKFG